MTMKKSWWIMAVDEGNAKLGYLKISFKSLEDNSKLLSPQD